MSETTSLLIALGDKHLVAGADWSSIDSMEKSDISEVLDRRRENNQPRAAHITRASTPGGMYALGVFAKINGFKKGHSLAAICSNFALLKKSNDSVFVFAASNIVSESSKAGNAKNDEIGHTILIGIKNGLPFYDAVFSDRDEFDANLGAILSMFDTGCTLYGDSRLADMVAPIDIRELADNPALLGSGALEAASSVMPIVIAVVAIFLIAIAVYAYYSVQKSNEASMRAAMKAAQEAQVAAEAKNKTESGQDQKIDKARKDYVVSHGLCSTEGAKNGFRAMTAIYDNYGGFKVKQIDAACGTGQIVATLESSDAHPDLFAFKKDAGLYINVDMKSAILTHSFDADRINEVDTASMMHWPDYFAMIATALVSLDDMGVKFSFSSPAKVLPAELLSDGIVSDPSKAGNAGNQKKQIFSGGISIGGDAALLYAIMNKLSPYVHWKTIRISVPVSGVASIAAPQGEAGNELQFKLEGEFYVVQ